MRLRLLLLAAVLLAAGAEPPKSDNKRPKQPAAQPNRTEPTLGTNQPAEKGKKITAGKGVTIPPPTGSVTRLQAPHGRAIACGSTMCRHASTSDVASVS
jgi:hypothetical protein